MPVGSPDFHRPRPGPRPPHAPAVTRRIPTVTERALRADADRATNTAQDLLCGLMLAREGMPDTARHAADLSGRLDAIITQLQIARGRFDARAAC